ncbi:MAG TPA: Rrf2 family transcriptional regulator [Clostridiales bacterium]|nr:Rrf2 family transcriptional regulator [Clostridiales bacterium]
MMVSTRGRYALRMMIDLAENSHDGAYIAMKDIAERLEISKKYMEQIMPVLVKNGLVEGMQGQGGGYRLTRRPEDYRVGEILRLTEGDLAPVSCLSGDSPCTRSGGCRTIAMWSRFNKLTNDFFDGITVADLMHKEE